MFRVHNEKFVCGCCGQLKNEKDRSTNSYRENNSVIVKWVCKQCNIVSGEIAKAEIDVIRDSNNKFKKSLVKFYDERGFLTLKQCQNINHTDFERVEYCLKVGDHMDIELCFDFADDQRRIRIINRSIVIANNSNNKDTVNDILYFFERIAELYGEDIDIDTLNLVSQQIGILENKLKNIQ